MSTRPPGSSKAKKKSAIQVEELVSKWMDSLGIASDLQIPFILPRRYEDYSKPKTSLSSDLVGQRVTTHIKAISSGEVVRDGKPKTFLKAVDMAGNQVLLSRFGESYAMIGTTPGTEMHVSGTLIQKGRSGFELAGATIAPQEWVGKVRPIYPKTTDKPELNDAIAGIAAAVLQDSPDFINEYVGRFFTNMTSKQILAKIAVTGLSDVAALILMAHRPKSLEFAKMAQDALATLATLEMVEQGKTQISRKPSTASVVSIKHDHIPALAKALPFTLSPEQQVAASDILHDLMSPFPMFRALSGDVGTGKTATFAIAAAAAQKANAQVTILVVNELVARQIHAEIASAWPDVPAKLVLDGTKTREIKAALPDNPILIGTTSLFSRCRKLKLKTDFLIIDEQHKLSLAQKQELLSENTNLLEASATFIPRTAALVKFGLMDVSTLKNCPVKKTIHSTLVEKDDQGTAFDAIKKAIGRGEQVAIIYPQVAKTKAEQERHNLEEAITRFEAAFPGKVVGLHGGMSGDEKSSIIDAMKQGRHQVLVTTTVIEVGVTLPDLKVVAVVRPDRYGVAQLHQLRGRVARKGGEGHFFMLLTDEIEQETRDRLNLLVNYSSGFDLSRHDMLQRGFGDLSDSSDSQTGASTSEIFPTIKLMPDDIERMAEIHQRQAPRQARKQSPAVTA